MPSWLVADRSVDFALEFMLDLQGRFANRVQRTSDATALISAREESFGDDIDCAMTAFAECPSRAKILA
jgi:hypothetical protein